MILDVSTLSFSISAPHTEIGNASIACNPAWSPKKTNGFSTFFSDDVYAC